MPLLPRLAAVALTLPLTACLTFEGVDTVERTVVRTYTVQPHSTVRVSLQGGSIRTENGAPGQVRLALAIRVSANSHVREDAPLEQYGITLRHDDGELVVRARQPREGEDWKVWKQDRVQVSARLVVPPDVRLETGTSGGSLTIRGEREESLRATTSGGSITVDGGAGPMELRTSGGSISIDHVLGLARAGTSGGRIAVRHVGRDATTIDLNTSGGSIHVGVDPAASLNITAQTSGGGVHIEGLPMQVADSGRSHTRGVMNGGQGQLVARTSGGSINISAVQPDGETVARVR